MRSLWTSRRTFTSCVGMLLVFGLGVYLKVDVSGAIAVMAVGLAGANAAQSFSKKE